MSPLKLRLFGLLCLLLFVFLAISLASYSGSDATAISAYPPVKEAENLCGPFGAVASSTLLNLFGWTTFFLFLPLGFVWMRLLRGRALDQPILRTIGLGLILFGMSGFCGLFSVELFGQADRLVSSSEPTETSASPLPALSIPDVYTPKFGPGGSLGAALAFHVNRHVTRLGGTALFVCGILAGLILCGDRMILFALRLCFGFGKRRVPVTAMTSAEYGGNEEVAADGFAVGESVLAEDSGQVEFEPVEEPEYSYEEPDCVEEGAPSPKKGFFRWMQGGSGEPKPDRMTEQTVRFLASQGGRIEPIEAPYPEDEQGEPWQEEYHLPSAELLIAPEPFDKELYVETVHRQAKQLEAAFADFGLQIEVVDIQTGPVISQFELKLSKGLRLNKIQALSEDLAIAMKVSSVRIVAPIPGKNTVGVELPNEHRQMVRLRDVMEQQSEVVEEMNIPIFLGKDVSGSPMAIDLTKLPHLLIAGRTGTGKSVCLNSIIVSILMTRGPEQVRMLMIDPKMVELSPYKTIPHLLHPVVTDMRKAEAILGWAVEKMEERYQLLAEAGVRQLSEFNKLSEDELRRRMKMLESSEEQWAAVPKSMPYLVIIADEMADLMMTAAKEVETHIIRLAQKSRAVGIHLVLATQKPTVDIITGLIKSNLPARIAFGVATRSDSQVVLDRNGAERLLGNGDMLFLQPGTSQAVRGQGTYVSDAEIESIIEAVGTEEQDFVEELVALDPDALDAATVAAKLYARESEKDSRDELYNEAAEYIIREGRGSLSLLQRRFSIGYTRAARLVDFMAEDGVVGEYNGSQAREVLMTLDDWQRFLRRRREGAYTEKEVVEPEPMADDLETRSERRSEPKEPVRDRGAIRREVPIRSTLPIRTATLPTLVERSDEPRLQPKYPTPEFEEPDDEDEGYFFDEDLTC